MTKPFVAMATETLITIGFGLVLCEQGAIRAWNRIATVGARSLALVQRHARRVPSVPQTTRAAST